jgi:hypothetical protein
LPKKAKPAVQNKPKRFTEFQGYEAVEKVARHLQSNIEKPCVSLYLTGQVWPQVGERSHLFYALAAEFKRVGNSKEIALKRLTDYYYRIPQEIIQAPGGDGRSFRLKEVESAVSSAYQNDKVKSYGCNSYVWRSVCPGKELCLFYQQLTGNKPQSRKAAYFAFLFNWLGKNKSKEKLLADSAIRVYLALELVEKKRGFPPGSTLFVSWRELSDLSGMSRQNIGTSLEYLSGKGLIAYQKGIAQERGTASEIRRVIPVPGPSNDLLYNQQGKVL